MYNCAHACFKGCYATIKDTAFFDAIIGNKNLGFIKGIVNDTP